MTDEIDWYSSDMATFGDRIAGAREAVGLSQRDLAHRLGVRPETLKGWEEDRSEPRSNRLQMLAGMLNVSIRWLLTGEGEGVGAPATDAKSEFRMLASELRGLRDDMARASSRLQRLERRLATLAEAEILSDARLKRLRLRSWRRGIREMDLLLGRFADTHLDALTAEELDLYEVLLEENDHDLYAWTTGREDPPEPLGGLIARVAAHARQNFAQQGSVL